MNIARDICQKSKLQDDDDHYTELELTHHSMCSDKGIIYRGSCVETISLHLTRFNKIAIKSKTQMAVDKEVVGLSRVRMYESNNCIMPLRDNCILC